ncbi:uncharacterized protein NEMAJ01_0206 [Nematocida major]|uniref:uncharacterized protein n=1 Tax=Nematocida major TaxID=1912982 RepID=UPI0020074E37|nr:uncharacterized protein NEMAJ01_0206 [Nematocida major]KAH9385310.1 hypothetical protein NEMAJ01_0206 [Nematocida major]
MEEATRTLLVTNFPKTVSHAEILRLCKSHGDVREHFIMGNKHSVFFVSFFDVRDAVKAQKALSEKFAVKFTISTREIPKGSDACTEEKNQGSVTYSGSEEIPCESSETFSSAKNAREFTVRFYDSRKACKFVSEIKSSFPRANPKFVWDNDLRRRITLLKAAEEIVKSAPGGFYRGIDEEAPQKRAPPAERAKRVKVSGNWMLALFDRFILENAANISLESKK